VAAGDHRRSQKLRKDPPWYSLSFDLSGATFKSFTCVEKLSKVAEKVESADASCLTKPYLYIQCIKQHALLVRFFHFFNTHFNIFWFKTGVPEAFR
jgi:hypothetical protein